MHLHTFYSHQCFSLFPVHILWFLPNFASEVVFCFISVSSLQSQVTFFSFSSFQFHQILCSYFYYYLTHLLVVSAVILYKCVWNFGCAAPHSASHPPNFWSGPQSIIHAHNQLWQHKQTGFHTTMWEWKCAVRSWDGDWNNSSIPLLVLNRMYNLIKIILGIFW